MDDILDGVNLLQRPRSFLTDKLITTLWSAPRLQFADHDGSDKETGGTGDGSGGSDSGSGDGSDSDSDEDDEEEDDPDPSKGDFRIKKLSREAANYRVKAKGLESELSSVQAKLREFEDKDKSEIEKLQRDLAEALERASKAEKSVKDRQIENAFLATNTVTWHNSERALHLLDLSEVEIDDDGKVKGMDKAIKALMKSDPYLVKSSDDDKKKPPSGTGGGKPPSGTGGDTSGANKDALMRKYPAAFAGR